MSNVEQPPIDRVEPFRENGAETDRDTKTGQFVLGNAAASKTDEHSTRFWKAATPRLRQLRADLLQAKGYTADDAPPALLLAIDGLGQAALLRDACFDRLAAAGGPTTSRDRRRSVFRVWTECSDRAERHLKLIGLASETKPVDPHEALRAAVEEANRS